jgi:chaperonin GroEL
VISTDIVQEALATLILNKQRGTLLCAAVKAPGNGDRRSAILDDIAILTGGRAFLEDLTRPLEEVSLRDLGEAKKVIVTKHSTTIIEGAGGRGDIERRMVQLRNEIDRTKGEFEQEKLRERLANLGGAMATIRSRGSNDDDKAESRYRIESALHSYRSAAENGWVPGGGTAYYRAKTLVSKLVAKNETEQLGIDIVSSALESPILHLMENSRASEPQRLLKAMLESQNEVIGFDAEKGEIEDLVRAGVLDPANTLKEALVQAFTYAEGILKTGAWDTTSTANPRGADGHVDLSDSF